MNQRQWHLHKHATVFVTVVLLGLLTLMRWQRSEDMWVCNSPTSSGLSTTPRSWQLPFRVQCEGAQRPLRGAAALLMRQTLQLNCATAAELAAIPGVSRRLANAIVAERDRHGALAGESELRGIPGLGPKRAKILMQMTNFTVPEVGCEPVEHF